jgi:hypothetical protein
MMRATAITAEAPKIMNFFFLLHDETWNTDFGAGAGIVA